MTEKLLILSRILGYTNPDEALVGFVDTYGLAFLIQALQYMCQLNDNDYRQEFAPSLAVVAIADDDDTAKIQLGKVLFGLITKVNFEASS
jgi:hypothetical protein